MKKLVFFLAVLITELSIAQSTVNFKSLRYDEDYSTLSLDSNATFYSKMKNTSLDKNHNFSLSIGGELRSQYQFFKNENWGDAPEDNNGFLLNRALLHTDLKFKNKLRLFTQLQSSTAISRITPNAVEKNELDIHQLFLDYYFINSVEKLTLRLGRQEVLFGSQRLVSVREGPNSRRAFDGAKLMFNSNTSTLSAFYLHEVNNVPDVFNDKITSNHKLFGTYNQFKKINYVQNIDLYYLGTYNKKAVFSNGIGIENRSTIGTRIWNTSSKWSYDFEAVYQFGKINGQQISAYTLSSNTSFATNKTKFGFKTEVISGDLKKEDNRLNTFNPLFPRGAYFGLAALIGPENLIDAHPYLEYEITDRIVLGLGYDMFWRYSKYDGIYGANVKPIFDVSTSDQRNIGTQLGLNFEFQVNPFLNLTLEGTWFNNGKYIKEVSTGKDIYFTAFTMQYKF